MATDERLLQGAVSKDPAHEDRDIESLLSGFVRALMQEQLTQPTASTVVEPQK